MSHWYEVFDNEDVQEQAHKQAAHLTVVAATVVLATLVGAALGSEDYLPLPLVGGALAATWLGTAHWIANRMRKLRRLVWCLKLSDERIVGYDYTRRKVVMDWNRVRRIELTGDGLLVIGPDLFAFEIPHLFPDFADLSHRVVYHAERHHIPVFIDERPWQEVDVYHLFPFLADALSADTPGAAV